MMSPDPLALTLGSIYDAAPTAPPSPPTGRRLDDSGTVKRRHLTKPAPPPSDVAPVHGARAAPPPSVAVPVDGARAAPPSSEAVPVDGASTVAAVRRRPSRRCSRGAAAIRRRPVDGARAAPPFPWATDRPARHDTAESLLQRGITTVTGVTRCKRCNTTATVAYDLEAKFREVRDYVAANRHVFNDRAPEKWMNPALPVPDCAACGQAGTMLPVISAEWTEINWLFLLLGCCALEQLKFFCTKTGLHSTGAKNRVLFYTFVEMCRQLEPQQPGGW